MSEPFEFYDQSSLIYRLSEALRSRQKEVVFLLGSPLSAPLTEGSPGVPNVSDIIDMIRDEFAEDADQFGRFKEALEISSGNRYQAAFRFLVGRKGQDVANEIVQHAVVMARTTPYFPLQSKKGRISDDECRALEADSAGWHLNPGLQSLGSLVTNYPDIFGRALLTTNFDPCVQQAINRAGGRSYRTTLHADGNLSQTEAEGCHVIHLHGYWWGSDTLHTPRQLTQPRPRLMASLTSLLRNKLLIVCGYGGWDDVFTRTLFDLVRDDSAAPEILWTFFKSNPEISSTLEGHLQAGIDRARVTLYEGIDCNSFLPLLVQSWSHSAPVALTPIPARSNPVVVRPTYRVEIEKRLRKERLLEGDDEDRPPQFFLCLGRETQLEDLEKTGARIIFITGIGGQGKSTLAAQYFLRVQDAQSRRLVVWRDCKEEGERFENQLASVIENLSNGAISGIDIARQDTESIIDVLLGLIGNESVLFVFDNVEHYISPDTFRPISSLDMLVRKLLSSNHKAQVVFTCRPTVEYRNPGCLSLHLEGISLNAARRLFQERRATTSEEEIVEAHDFTNGHAFWLDLLAIQTAKRYPQTTLHKLVGDIGHLPDNTLQSIWSTLAERERLVLRVLAETVKPSTEFEVAEYLAEYLNFNKASRAFHSLKSQNLVVIKKLPNGDSVSELHPLVRYFVRTHFAKVERQSFITSIINAYRRFIGKHARKLADGPSIVLLQHWTQKAELDVSAGNFSDACQTLQEASKAFSASAFSREYTRAARLLLGATDWVSGHATLGGFDEMFEAHIENLCYLGEIQEIDALLEKYAMTVVERNARYILYCDMKCYSKWVRGDFKDAVVWGNIGVALLESSNLEIVTKIRHNLALSQRDAGEPEIALEFFLKGLQLSAAINPDELDDRKGGHYYGNVGRCLHFMGQNEGALICYQKSALVIEKDVQTDHVLNQGYIRWWIGELLLARGQQRLGSTFIEAAARKWDKVAPSRERQIRKLQENLSTSLVEILDSDLEIELTCRRWILGEYLDDIPDSPAA